MISLDYEGGGRRVSNAKILMTQYVLCIVYSELYTYLLSSARPRMLSFFSSFDMWLWE